MARSIRSAFDRWKPSTKIKKESNGQIDIRVYPNSELGGDPEQLTQLRLGALEMTAQAGIIIDSQVPIADIENVAFAFPNREAAFAAMDGDLGALIRKQAYDKKMLIIDKVFENGWRDFTSGLRPIRSVDDLSGMRLRVSPGKIRIDTFRSLGAAVTPVASNELYTALQTHIVDGMESALGVIESFRVYEVQKYLSRSHHMWSGYWNIISLDKWNTLPPALQKIMRTHLNEAAVLQRRDSELGDKSLEDLLRRQGLAINYPKPETFKAKLVASGYYGRWKTEFGEQAWSALEKYTGKLG